MSDTSRASPATATTPPGLDYLRSCYSTVLDWYRVADSKAQLLVTINGLVVTVVTGTAFSEPTELRTRLGEAGPFALLALALAALFMLVSLVCAVACLFSRLDDAKLRGMHASLVGATPPYQLTPELAWWFGMIATLTKDAAQAKAMSDYLMTADEDFEAEALASQIVILSQNTLAKHKWVNHGWLATVASLVSIVAFGALYTLGVLAD